MKNKVLMVLIGLTLTLSMVLGILAGCGAPATPTATVAPTGTATVKPTATATAKPKTTAAPTPTKAGEVIEWRCQSTNSAGDPLWWAQQEFVERIKIMSGGRLVLKLFPAGAIVARVEAYDAVSVGAIECTPGYSENDSIGRDLAYGITSIPAGMSNQVQLLWMNYHTEGNPIAPGAKFFKDLYAKNNIMAFNVNSSTPEVEYMANKKILKPSDYKGLTFRGAGWELDILAQPEFGAKPVFIPSSDVFSALMTGVIDALEQNNPYGNYVAGYADVTKYWGFPGMHNRSQTSHMMINMDVWKKLPADLQKIVEVACQAQQLTNSSFSMVESAKILPVLVQKGITLVYQTPEVQNFWRSMMLKTALTYEKERPGFNKLLQEALDFQYMMDAYIDLQNPVYDSTYPGKKENIKGVVWQ